MFDCELTSLRLVSKSMICRVFASWGAQEFRAWHQEFNRCTPAPMSTVVPVVQAKGLYPVCLPMKRPLALPLLSMDLGTRPSLGSVRFFDMVFEQMGFSDLTIQEPSCSGKSMPPPSLLQTSDESQMPRRPTRSDFCIHTHTSL